MLETSFITLIFFFSIFLRPSSSDPSKDHHYSDINIAFVFASENFRKNRVYIFTFLLIYMENLSKSTFKYFLNTKNSLVNFLYIYISIIKYVFASFSTYLFSTIKPNNETTHVQGGCETAFFKFRETQNVDEIIFNFAKFRNNHRRVSRNRLGISRNYENFAQISISCFAKLRKRKFSQSP